MSIIRCEKGHYYDNTKFSQCPQCGVLPILQEEKQLERKVEKPHRFSFFRREVKKKMENTLTVTSEDDDDMTIAVEPDDDDVTIAIEPDDGDDVTIAVEPEEDDDVTIAVEPDDDDDVTIAVEPEEDDDVTIAVEPENDDDVTIAVELEDDDVTIAVESEEDDDVTIAIEPEKDDDPTMESQERTTIQRCITGWIVCLNGKNRGMDYGIYKGFNRMVSRADNMYLTMEPKSEDRVACAVVYDDVSNRFFIMAQESEVKKNGIMVSGAEELHSGDQIELENQRFEFVAFCGEGKNWNADR